MQILSLATVNTRELRSIHSHQGPGTRYPLGIGFLSALGIVCSALAADVKVLAPNAAKEAVLEAVSVSEKETGHKVIVSWSGTEAITKRVAEGEAVDVVVNAAQNVDRQSRYGKLAPQQGT